VTDDEWRYGFRWIGPHETRHAAIGAAVIDGMDATIANNHRWDREIHAVRAEDICSAIGGVLQCSPWKHSVPGECRFCGEVVER
jgi:hypothetical protein